MIKLQKKFLSDYWWGENWGEARGKVFLTGECEECHGVMPWHHSNSWKYSCVKAKPNAVIDEYKAQQRGLCWSCGRSKSCVEAAGDMRQPYLGTGYGRICTGDYRGCAGNHEIYLPKYLPTYLPKYVPYVTLPKMPWSWRGGSVNATPTKIQGCPVIWQ